jgi:hypothetical protein
MVSYDLLKIIERFRGGNPSAFSKSETVTSERAAGVSAPQFRFKVADISLNIIFNCNITLGIDLFPLSKCSCSMNRIIKNT